MNLVNRSYGRRNRKVLKKSKTGMEVEFHLIDDKGRISHLGNTVIADVQDRNDTITITTEIGRNMVEFGCYPDVPTYNPAMDLIYNIAYVNALCKKRGLQLFPFGTYPGKYTPLLTPKDRYRIKKKIFGEMRVNKSAQVTGFHHHYSLPKGVFDSKKKYLKLLRRSNLERTMMSAYNFEIAADPALTLFTQSSPFFQGVHFAKDTRMVVYRGGKKLKCMDAVYSDLQSLGALPPYKQTVTDLVSSLNMRSDKWRKEVGAVAPSENFDKMYSKLDIGWNPVKINEHGTLEQRGMDVNYVSILVAVTVLLKFSLRKIYREFIEVIPADFAVQEPFKLENGIMYIPPHTHVRNQLQLWSAYSGYGKKEMHNFSKKFFHFARSVTPKRYTKIIKPVYDMIENKQSISDKILHHAKYKGYMTDNKIGNRDAAALALYYAEQFDKDLETTWAKLENLSGV